MRLRLDLSTEATERLIRKAIQQRRPVAMQAEVLLLEALGIDLDGAVEEHQATERPEAVQPHGGVSE